MRTSDAPGVASGGMSHRPRFSEWQHPDVKSFLRADASRERAVASQARALLAFSALVPLLARLARHRGRGRDARGLDRRAQRRRRASSRYGWRSPLAGARGGGGADGSAAARAGEPPPRRRRISARAAPARRGARGGPRDAEVDPAFKRLDLDDDGARMRGDASGKPRRRRFGATSRDAAYEGTSATRGPADGPLFVGIGAFLPGAGGEGADVCRRGRGRRLGVRDARGRDARGRAGIRGGVRGERGERAARRRRDSRARDERFGGFGRATEARRGRVAWTPRTTTRSRPTSATSGTRGRLFRRGGAGRRRVWGSPGGRGARRALEPRRDPGSGGAHEAATEVASRSVRRPRRARLRAVVRGSPGGRYQFRPSPPPRARRRRRAAGGPGARAAGAAGTSAATSARRAERADVRLAAPEARRWRTSGGPAARVVRVPRAPAARARARAEPRGRRAHAGGAGRDGLPRPRPLLSADDAHGDRERAGYNARGAETAGALEQDAMVLEQMRVRLEPRSRTPERSRRGARVGGGGGGLPAAAAAVVRRRRGFGACPQQQQQQQQRSEKEHQIGALAAAGRHRDALPAHRAPRAELPRGLLP